MTKPHDPIPPSYKPWIILSLTILVGSLALGAAAVVANFVAFGNQTTPLWVIVLSVLAIFGVLLGFAGFFLLMLAAGFQSWRASRKVQILPPDHPADPRDTAT